VLDANIAIAALNRMVPVRERLAHVPTADVGIPIVAMAELTYGAYKSMRRQANLERIAALRRSISVLDITDQVVDLYGSTPAALESRGLVKSDFDLLIACTALSESAMTSDHALLDGTIPGLRAENWLDERPEE
jgi:predicted nucleic acid-binding protein